MRDANSILVFKNASTANGNVSPSRIISGGNTALSGPTSLWYDSTTDQLYVANYYSSVLVFTDASTANGDIVPSRIVYNSALYSLGNLWYDSASNQLYVVNNNDSILVFTDASTANGDIPPSRIISNSTLYYPRSLWYDSTSKQLYVTAGLRYSASVLVFTDANIAGGNVTPAQVISGSTTRLFVPGSLWYDAIANRLYVLDKDSFHILVFTHASTANGNIAPSYDIYSNNLYFPEAIWYDSAKDQLYVTNGGERNSILVFNNASTINGSVSPSRTITY